ncbi:MAG: hypothetical protein GXO94_08400 [Nitrospirae bacterium]|nr:hypothetical protein [Nitrospirota bacterium]
MKGISRSGFVVSILCAVLLSAGAARAEKRGVDLAFEHLYEVMDRYHRAFYVYTDLSAAGNHFVTLGRMSSPGDADKVGIEPGFRGDCLSGSTCIRNTFSSAGDNWGGWYFMNGVLEGEDTVPKLNWGEYPDAGFDLSGATRLTFHARGERGGERVEFFAFGLGRDPATGSPLTSYPDSSPKISTGYITLSETWREYSIDLAGADLSYVIGGFAWVSASDENGGRDITFYLDDISYDKGRLDEPRFLVSFETIPSTSGFDSVMKNVAFGYDNALALLAFLSRGRPEDLERAGLLADAFVYAVNNDRYFTDGRLRNGYQGGDLALFPGWTPRGKAATVRMPGWWDDEGSAWYEDEFTVSTHTGNVVWPLIALVNYYRKAGGDRYLEAALTLGEWTERETRDDRCAGGYTGGYAGWEESAASPAGQEKLLYKSTEHNIDIYVAFMLLYQETGDAKWKEGALRARAFVESMWNGEGGYFWTGTLEDGCTTNRNLNSRDVPNIPLDIQAWAVMALDSYQSALSWTGAYTEHHGFKGFDFNNDRDGVWFEGTAQMAVAYQLAGDTEKADAYISELRKAMTSAANSNGKGIVAACHDSVTTGFEWDYPSRVHVGATAWYIFAEEGFNPYWGSWTGTAPDDEDDGSGDERVCLLSAAASGTPLQQRLGVLRAFRDDHLLTNPPGRAFSRLYYRVSSAVAGRVAAHETLGMIIRKGLAVLIFAVENPPYAAAAGAVLIVPLFAYLGRRKKHTP